MASTDKIGNRLYKRRISLLMVGDKKALDLSDMHIVFDVKAEDEESPNNARIRVHNLSPDTVRKIKGEYAQVVLQAGYEDGLFGVIFQGTVKQWGVGRESNRLDTYLDILAGDGDVAYNFAVCRRTLAAGSTPKDRVQAAISAMNPDGVQEGALLLPQSTGGVLPRGKVLFGLARAALRRECRAVSTTWNISNGRVNVVPLDGYLPGEAVVLNSLTGLIGRPEQTQDGIKARVLINPRIGTGTLVKIDQASINAVGAQKDHVIPGAQLPYNQWAGIQQLADVTADGLYRVYVVEATGDTRGLPWYMDLILLAVDPVSKKVVADD